MSVWGKSHKEVFSELNSSEGGITGDDARERLKRYGYNELKEKKKISPLQILIRQFKNFLIILLLIAALISMGVGFFEGSIGEGINALLIVMIVVFIAVVGFYQEYHAERELEALKEMLAPDAIVLRDGLKKKIPAKNIVPGDIILLEAGDRIPADARLFEAIELKIDESALTGESVSVPKTIETLEGAVQLADRRNMVFMGTSATYGKGKAVVVETGMNTAFGEIATKLQEIEEERTPLQRKLDKLGKDIGVVVLILCAIVFFSGLLINKEEPITMFIIAIALAVAAVPEGLPGVVTVALATGTRRMVESNVIIRKLPAVETLGCTTVICSDKTGTLTKNEMTIRKLYMVDAVVYVTGEGYSPRGEFLLRGEKIEINENESLKLLLRIGALCNNASLGKTDDRWTITGDPTEACLIVASEKAGVEQERLEREYPRVGEMPFDSDRKMMTTIHEIKEGKIAYVKGAPDMIMEKCDRILDEGRVRAITEDDRDRILKMNENFGRGALRILGMAYREIDTHDYTPENTEKNLVFVGLAGMIDSPREDAIGAVEECRKAGIKSVMITGDHKITAIAVAKEVGMYREGDRALTGMELDDISDEELEKMVEDVSIYARVSPQHKLRIVDALKKRGHVVAMTGDGVNDAPALKRADIGIAMGITGTDVSKEASDMVLVDDNFASIVSAVEEGRGIYGNIKKFFAYLISGNIGEVTIIFLSCLIPSLLHIPLPIALTAAQILIINLVTDGLPALALGVDPFEPHAMRRKPRNSKEPIHAGLTPFILGYPLIMVAVTLILFLWIYNPEIGNDMEAQTVVFLTIAMFEMYQAFSARSTRYPSIEVGIFRNKYLILAVSFSFLFCLALVYLPLDQVLIPFTGGENLRDALHVTYIDPGIFILILLLSSTGFIYLELHKLWREHRSGE